MIANPEDQTDIKGVGSPQIHQWKLKDVPHHFPGITKPQQGRKTHVHKLLQFHCAVDSLLWWPRKRLLLRIPHRTEKETKKQHQLDKIFKRNIDSLSLLRQHVAPLQARLGLEDARGAPPLPRNTS